MLKLFGTDIPLRSFGCSLNGSDPEPISPHLTVYIRVTNECPYNCPFCIYHKAKNSQAFSQTKLSTVLNELVGQNVPVKRFSITGGEPTYSTTTHRTTSVVASVLEMLSYWKNSTVIINTNGWEIRKISLADVDCISLSRHHWGIKECKDLFGYLLSPVTIQREGIGKLQLRCNLIKGYVDNVDGILEYIQRYSKICDDFAFVSLMKVNDFCKEHFVDSRTLDFKEVPRVRRVRQLTRGGCICQNYVTYTNEGKLIRFYTRTDDLANPCESILVFDMTCLRNGFNGKIIYGDPPR